ncbi:unnamed protein product [Symbiodinium sp. CCMP2592]|nr:unnamed protein product [Symbiodinium sp. CCMP2592]
MTLTADPMELDEQERQFWAQAGPVKREQEPRRDMLQPAEQSKRQRLAPQDRNKGKGKGIKGKGKGKQGLPSPPSAHPAMGYTNGFGSHPPNPWTQTQDLQPLGSQDPEWMECRMNRLSQLVLRQEQIISAIRQDLVLYLFVRSGPEGMVPVLCDAAEKWRKMKEEEPEKITYSLKLMLFKQLLITLHQTLTTMIADEDALAKAKNLNWIDDQKHWKHLTWNPSKQCLEVDEEGCYGGDPGEIQVHAEAHHGGDLRLDPIPDMLVTSSRGWSHVEHAEPVDRSSIVAHTGMQASPRPTELRHPGPGSVAASDAVLSVRPSLKAVLRLILHNPSNLCYLHSTIYALLWTILQARLHDAHISPPPQALTMLCPPITDSSNCPIQVLHSVPWLMLLQAWPSVHRQHDAAELIQYLLPRFSHSGFNGGWEARNFAPGGIVTLDTGPTQAPIPIALPAGPSLELQEAIDGWSAQVTARYALLTPSSLLCIQLQRFTNAEGDMRRDTRPMAMASTTVRMPLFAGLSTMQVRYVHYQVVAVQLHYGDLFQHVDVHGEGAVSWEDVSNYFIEQGMSGAGRCSFD